MNHKNHGNRQRTQHAQGQPQPLKIDYGFTPGGQIVITTSIVTKHIVLDPEAVDHMIEQLQNAKKMMAEHRAKKATDG